MQGVQCIINWILDEVYKEWKYIVEIVDGGVMWCFIMVIVVFQSYSYKSLYV